MLLSNHIWPKFGGVLHLSQPRIFFNLDIHGSWISSCNIDLDPAICSQAIDRDGGKGAAAKRDNDEFVAEAVRDTPSQQQQQAPPQQAPPQQVIEQMSHEHF